jgi:hypothetical protein
MSGAHRSTTHSPVASAGKSIVWMLQLAGAAALLVVPFAVLGFVVYTLISQPSKAWTPPVVVASAISICVFAIAHIVWYRMRRSRGLAGME